MPLSWTVNVKFLFATLEIFGFEDSFMNWVLYTSLMRHCLLTGITKFYSPPGHSFPFSLSVTARLNIFLESRFLPIRVVLYSLLWCDLVCWYAFVLQSSLFKMWTVPVRLVFGSWPLGSCAFPVYLPKCSSTVCGSCLNSFPLLYSHFGKATALFQLADCPLK